MFPGPAIKGLSESELLSLLKQGKCEELLSILKGKSIKQYIDQNGNHLLHKAAKTNNTEQIKFLIASGCDVSVRDSSGRTPFIIAIIHKNFEVARILYVAQIKSLDRGQLSLFRDIDVVVKLKIHGLTSEQIGEALAKGTDFRAHHVVRLKDPLINKAYFELQDGINISMAYSVFNELYSRNGLQQFFMIINMPNMNTDELFEWFCDFIKTRFHYTHKYDNTFLKRIFNFEVFNEKNLESLEKALMNSDKKNLKIFLLYDFHKSVKEKYNRDILACFFGNRYTDVISLLGDDQINIGGRGYGGKSALHFAAEANMPDNIKMLLERRADPNVLDDNGLTPLCSCLGSQSCHEMCIKLLLQAGGNPLLISNKQEILSRVNTNFSNFINVNRHVIAQIIIYETLGQSIEKSKKLFKNWNNEELEIFRQECHEYLNQLKARKIRDTQFSLFTVMVENPINLARSVNREDVEAIFTFLERNEKILIPYYHSLLKTRAEEIIQLQDYRERAIQYICDFINVHDPHHLVVNKIVDYLSVRDLRKFLIDDSQSKNEKLTFKAKIKNWLKLTKKRILKS